MHIADLLKTYTPPPKPRQAFIDEAFDRINLERKGTKYKVMSKRQIALMVNSMCPKGCPDSFIVDVRKSCQVAKSYGKMFWYVYHQSKKT